MIVEGKTTWCLGKESISDNEMYYLKTISKYRRYIRVLAVDTFSKKTF